MNFYELNEIINEQSYQQFTGRPDRVSAARMKALVNQIKNRGRPIGFSGPYKLSKEIEDELAKIGNIETHEEAMEKWRKIEKQDDAEKEYMRQKEEERWSPFLRSKEDDYKELTELEDWLDSQGYDDIVVDINDIEDVSAVYKTLGSLNDPRQDDRKMIEKLGQHLKRLESKKVLAKMF